LLEKKKLILYFYTVCLFNKQNWRLFISLIWLANWHFSCTKAIIFSRKVKILFLFLGRIIW
jgi:hypothetical protein